MPVYEGDALTRKMPASQRLEPDTSPERSKPCEPTVGVDRPGGIERYEKYETPAAHVAVLDPRCLDTSLRNSKMVESFLVGTNAEYPSCMETIAGKLLQFIFGRIRWLLDGFYCWSLPLIAPVAVKKFGPMNDSSLDAMRLTLIFHACQMSLFSHWYKTLFSVALAS